ncbi:MAG: ATP-binding cassette domain-containing protein [Alphaproteobacteria bacterium]|nr:ATP-binding cassette domain-containing protein [Alphaproteobacteria bacterium]
MTTLALDHVTTIFGPASERAWPLLAEGRGKADILDRTGLHLALNAVSLTVASGEVLAVMGASGSGKSTLLRTFNLLVRPTRGDVLVAGRHLCDLAGEALRDLRRQTFGMVFQGFGLLPHLTVIDNVAFPLMLAGIDKNARLDRARVWLDRVGLGGEAKSRPDQLSAGMQQRVGLARALINDPPVLLMDEPFAALDPITRRDMQDQLLRLQSELKKTVVMITHDPADAMRLADRVAVLRDGALIQVGTYRDITLHPADEGVAAFVRGFGPARAPMTAVST